MSSVSQESVVEPALFNVFVGGMDSGMECTLSKFVNNTRLCGVVNKLEVKEGCHPERP